MNLFRIDFDGGEVFLVVGEEQADRLAAALDAAVERAAVAGATIERQRSRIGRDKSRKPYTENRAGEIANVYRRRR